MSDNLPDLDEFIRVIVEDRGPVKGVDLALEVAKHQHDVTEGDLTEALRRLVRDEVIIELEYVLPSMDYRTKSMFFPKGTRISRAL